MSPNQNALVVMPSGERRSQLIAALKALEVDPVEAEDCRQARLELASRRPVNLVISDVDFRDGDWRDTLAAAQQRPDQTPVLVSTPLIDYGLWSEVLWRGAYDLLVEPYSASELRRIVEGALRTYRTGGPPLRAIAEAV